MSRQTRRSMLATVGTALTSALAGCSNLTPFSEATSVEYDESAIAALPGDIPPVPPATPVQPTDAHLTSARDRIRSLLDDTGVSQVPNAVVRDRLAAANVGGWLQAYSSSRKRGRVPRADGRLPATSD
ncbi:MAG: hypothetical protein V5A38_08215 [Halolamina sp.]|uniref:hypothetical protein n=1 Tax=Halolamina sp. TaxID=1940283 RepID=UPI002FC3D48D